MVLVIDGRVYSQSCTFDCLAAHADLMHASRLLASSTELQQPAEEVDQTIYVGQREFAIVANDDPHGFHWLGSDDATTCHILVLDNQVAVALAHLDGCETRQSIEAICRSLQQYAPENSDYDVYLAGGFLDQSDRQYSLTLSNEILDLLAKLPNMTFHLKLAAITAHNNRTDTDGTHYPMIYGLCFDVHTRTLRKMSFVDYGPAFRLRMVHQSTGHHPACCLYSSSHGTVQIKRFQIDRDTIERYYRRLHKYYFRDDQRLLAMTSTSPKQERSTYVENMKKTILYILKYHEQLPEWFDPDTRSLVYRRANGRWITDNDRVVDDVHIEQ